MTTSSDNSNTFPLTPSVEELDRYLSGDASPRECERVSAWVETLPDGRRGVEMLRAMDPAERRSVDPALHLGELTAWIRESSPELVDRNLVRSRAVAAPATATAASSFPASRRIPAWSRAMLVSACAAILLVAGWATATYRLNSQLSDQVSTYTTENGERARITLPDGSEVTLNVGSRIEVPANFASGNRTLSLQGEALFTVKHHSSAPFIIITPSTTTRVLGTRFIVREYILDTTAVVAVQDGRVAVGGAILSAGQELAIHRGKTDNNDIRPADYKRFGFDEGKLVLDGVLLRDAIPDLNRWFNAQIQLGDASLGTRILSGDCTTGSVANLAELLELTFDIKVIRKNNILTLYSKDI